MWTKCGHYNIVKCGGESMKASARKKRGKWVAHVEIGFDSNGKRIQITKVPNENSKQVAQELANELMADYMKGTFYKGKNTSLGEFLSEWLEVYKSEVEYNTYRSYESFVRLYINPNIGSIRLDKLQSNDIQNFYNNIRDNSSISPTTIRRMHSTLHNALDFALQRDLIPRNVSEKVSLPRQKRFRPNTITEEQLISIIKATKETEIYIPVLIAALTGMRRGEVAGLKWENINFDSKTISIKHSLQRRKCTGLVLKQPKTEDSYRTIKMNDTLYSVLIKHKSRQGELSQYNPNEFNNGFVCTFNDGRPIDPDYITKRFNKILKKIDVPHIRFHDLRHTFATILLSKGIQVKFVSEILGHTSTKITQDIYSHVFMDSQEEAVNKININLD